MSRNPAEEGIMAAREEERLRRANKLKLYIIKFKLTSRPGQVFKWERWYQNKKEALIGSRKAIYSEFPAGYIKELTITLKKSVKPRKRR